MTVQQVINPFTVPPPRYDDFSVLRRNAREQVQLTTRDPDSQAVRNPTQISVQLINQEDQVVATGRWPTPVAPEFQITNRDIGRFMWELDSTLTIYEEPEYLAAWEITWDTGRIERPTSLIAIAENQYFRLIPRLRLLLDKARKSVLPDPNALTFGYDERHCVFYLDMGCQFWNAISPQTAMNVTNFPAAYQVLLLEGAMFAALTSQGIFAIDTDFDYSLGGNSISIDHQSRINSLVGSRYDSWYRVAEQAKQPYRNQGMALVTAPFGWHIARYLRAAPPEVLGRMFALMSPTTWTN